jgi:hypothetical protein
MPSHTPASSNDTTSSQQHPPLAILLTPLHHTHLSVSFKALEAWKEHLVTGEWFGLFYLDHPNLVRSISSFCPIIGLILLVGGISVVEDDCGTLDHTSEGTWLVRLVADGWTLWMEGWAWWLVGLSGSCFSSRRRHIWGWTFLGLLSLHWNETWLRARYVHLKA